MGVRDGATHGPVEAHRKETMMESAAEYWRRADLVAAQIRSNDRFDMGRVSHPCGSPACIAGDTCVAMGRADLLARGTITDPLEFAASTLGFDEHWQFFRDDLVKWGADLRARYRSGDRQAAAIEALYREIEKVHGPRPHAIKHEMAAAVSVPAQM